LLKRYSAFLASVEALSSNPHATKKKKKNSNSEADTCLRNNQNGKSNLFFIKYLKRKRSHKEGENAGT
jgi:hypothetical protein